jgi:ssDNA-binding Zn-finger/Zn-ribbon topoisomerase 1
VALKDTKKSMAKRASELETLTMVYGYVGYCQCGYEVWIEYLRDGTGWFLRFFDANHQEIYNCPACGRAMTEDDLESLKN